jgi:hypothetical protein
MQNHREITLLSCVKYITYSIDFNFKSKPVVPVSDGDKTDNAVAIQTLTLLPPQRKQKNQ